jgi:hypothetical protein
MAKYDECDWVELPEDVKKAAEALGYTHKLWDKGKEPAACDKYFKDLSPEQQEHAKKLGYDQKSWDKE